MNDAHSPHPDPHAAAHPRFLAHHFASYRQQYNAGKLGMWIFLLTEILLFGAMFCAYAVYRANHPEIFIYAHQFLDKTLGAINTGVLIFSSLTMAWGVRCAQLNQRRGLIVCLLLTLVCAAGFLSIKYVEYRHKWQEGLLWASRYDPHAPPSGSSEGDSPSFGVSSRDDGRNLGQSPKAEAKPVGATAEGYPIVPRHVGLFFSIYFLLTGLHGIHVLAGMAAITWILRRAVRGDFNRQYFGPVDYVGLYWHLVDMVWIYLFPLLYLIH
jgi:cytochrome c oxidase subunit 3